MDSIPGPQLSPGQRYFWKVRVWDKNDKPSQWSTAGEFVTGLFEKVTGAEPKWIGYEEIPDSLLLVPGVHGSGDNLGNIAKKRTTVPCFRKEFSLEKKIITCICFCKRTGAI